MELSAFFCSWPSGFGNENGDGSYSLKADGSTDGYWKLLIDFKMYDNEGNGSPQMAVKPDFNMKEATRTLNDYSGGHSNFPVAQGIVDSFVKEYKDSHKGAKFSDGQNGKIPLAGQETVKYSDTRFFPGNVFPSGLTHTSVAEWANRKDVKTGDKRLVLHRGTYYRVENSMIWTLGILSRRRTMHSTMRRCLESMKRLTAENPMRACLMKGLKCIERDLHMDREDIMLILLDLDTEDKIAQFMEWVLSKTVKGELLAKPNEIVRTACEISDSLEKKA